MGTNKDLIMLMGSKPEQLLRAVVLETLRLEAAEVVAGLAPAGAEADIDVIVDALADSTPYQTILQMPEAVRWPTIVDRLQTEAAEERRIQRALILDYDARDGVTLLTRHREEYVLTKSDSDHDRTSEVLTLDHARAYLHGRGATPAFVALATDPAQWPAQSSGGRSWFQEHLSN